MSEWIHRATICFLALTLATRTSADDESALTENVKVRGAWPHALQAEGLQSWHNFTAFEPGTGASLATSAPIDDEIVLTSFETSSDTTPATLELPADVLPAPSDTNESSTAARPPQKESTATNVQSPAETPADAEGPAIAGAESIPEWASQSPPDALNLGDLISRLVIATGIVLVLAVVSVLAIKKWMGPIPSTRQTPSQRLKHIESLALPQRASLQLVELDGRPILIGMNAAGLQTIAPVEKSFAESLKAIEDEADDSVSVELTPEMTPGTPNPTNEEPATAKAETWTEKTAAFLSSQLTSARGNTPSP